MDNQKTITKMAEDMFNVGAHYALTKRYRHPSVVSYIHATKQKTDIFDLEQTAKLFLNAMDFMQKLGANKKKVLFATSRNEAKDVLHNSAKSIGMPYVSGRWIGGMLTNFSSIEKRIKRLKQLKAEYESDAWNKKTKKERLLLVREMSKLNERFFGVSTMDSLPQALLVVDPKKESIAIEEALKVGIPIIGLSNADADISNIDYPVIANITAKKGLEFLLAELTNSYKKTKTETE